MHLFFLGITLISFRHFFIEGDHLWTGEGARLSWSMRLKGKLCELKIKVNEGQWQVPDLRKLSFTQQTSLDDPYFFLLYVKTLECPPHNQVYADFICRAVSRQPAKLINSSVNLCQVDYQFFSHNGWINPYPGPIDPEYRTWFEHTVKPLAQ